MNGAKVDKKTYYRGIRMIPYDLLKEVTIAMIGVLGVVLILSAVLSSPDVPSVTLQSWSKANPVDFLTTATGELSGSTVVAGYGPPYNSQSGSVQSWGPLSPQQWAGVHVPVNAPNDFVLQPLKGAALDELEASIPTAVQATVSILEEGIELAMREYNGV